VFCFVLFFAWLHSGDFLSWIILALSLFVPTTQLLHFGFVFLARDAPASSSCDTDDGGFNPLLLFCVLLQNYLACLFFSPSSLDVSSFSFVLLERVSMAAESGLQSSVAERRFRRRAVL
jgi:hypothetical protein